MRCLCGELISEFDVEHHRKAWFRHGACLYKVARIRARKVGMCALQPISFDIDYYYLAWLRLMKNKPKSMEEAMVYCMAVYMADSPEFRSKFMSEDPYPARSP